MYHERDAWDAAGNMGTGIEGQHLKCAKGNWLLDEESIETGEDGFQCCIIMDTATVGEVLWKEKKIVERNTGRLSDGFVPKTPNNISLGWNPYTSVMAVRCDEGHLGDLVTFTSSSWGGWFAFQRLINPWRLKGRKLFPRVTLATKERSDQNCNIDPVFKIFDWSARSNFSDLLDPAQLDAPSIAPALEAKSSAARNAGDLRRREAAAHYGRYHRRRYPVLMLRVGRAREGARPFILECALMVKFPQDRTSRELRRQLQSTEKMNRLMDGLCGPGNWVFDPTEDVWVTRNDHGPGVIVVMRGGDWFVSTRLRVRCHEG